MTPTALRADVRRSSETQVWRDLNSHRATMGNRVAAESFSPRALFYAMPMATFLWLAAAAIAYPYL